MTVKITTLSENTAIPRPRGLLAEWGLSILAEIDGTSVLLDAGQSISTVNNGDLLGIDWSKIDHIVLSHGHYDHTGGLPSVLRRTAKRVEVIAHPDVWAAKYWYMPGMDSSYIGVPFCREEVEGLGATFRLSTEPVWITDNVVTSGEVPLTTDFESVDADMFYMQNGELVQDTLRDDQALFIKSEQGLVVLLGCAHRGIINTLLHAQNVTGTGAIHAVVGGTHLFRATELQLELTLAELKSMGVQRLGISHCTGLPVMARLRQEFGDVLFFNNAGTSITM